MLAKRIIVVFLLSFSALANATVISVNYEGVVTSGGRSDFSSAGFDFGVRKGDAITGSFLINLENLPSDVDSDPLVYEYSSPSRGLGPEFVSMTSSANLPDFLGDRNDEQYQNFDYALLDARAHYNQLLLRSYDYIDKSAMPELSLYVGSRYQEINLYEFVDLGKFRGGLSAETSFSLSESELSSFRRNEGFIRINMYNVNDEAGTRIDDDLVFKLTRINVHAVEVSAPNALGTLMLGIFVVGARRFMKHTK